MEGKIGDIIEGSLYHLKQESRAQVCTVNCCQALQLSLIHKESSSESKQIPYTPTRIEWLFFVVASTTSIAISGMRQTQCHNTFETITAGDRIRCYNCPEIHVEIFFFHCIHCEGLLVRQCLVLKFNKSNHTLFILI